jgi:3-methyladenine DNA glycosylase AlkD
MRHPTVVAAPNNSMQRTAQRAAAGAQKQQPLTRCALSATVINYQSRTSVKQLVGRAQPVIEEISEGLDPGNEIHTRLQTLGDKKIAQFSQRFFKTGPGEYGDGDLFLGIRVPVLRKLAREYQSIDLDEVLQLLRSAFHEERLLALLILVRVYAQGEEAIKKQVYQRYMKNTRFINSWDLVDPSSPYIVGDYLMKRNKKPLYVLVKSDDLWERRIAITATFHFIKQEEFGESLKIAKLLLNDKEDLIHKAVGWMLREIGKRHLPSEEEFLREHYWNMPRAMLRYAIEKFPEAKRRRYLKVPI